VFIVEGEQVQAAEGMWEEKRCATAKLSIKFGRTLGQVSNDIIYAVMEMMDLNGPWESSRKIPENTSNSGDTVSGSSMSVGALVVELHPIQMKIYSSGVEKRPPNK
jgi:hypothetical protein